MEGLALVPIMLAFGISGGLVGRRKGSSFWIWFVISMIPPFIGLLAAIFYRYETDELRRPCPSCGRVLRISDAVCTRCGKDLEWPEFALPPKTAPPVR
ncbi:MAG: hypothetical protein JWN32_30 [Solirubrobacterales bacterium]|nr:hypothetical protein [Solirubrobacterales bacterium]